jgi:O-antigen/teichoic acid export membrane protein
MATTTELTSRGRAVVKDVAVYGFGDATVKGTAFITLLVLARVFGPSTYGLLSLMTTVFGLLTSLLILGGDSAYVRFFFDTTDNQERRVLTVTWIAFLALEATLVCLVIAPFARPLSSALTGSSRASTPILVLLATAPVVIVNRMLGQGLRNQFRSVPYVTLNVSSAVCDLAASLIAVLVFHRGVTGALAGTLIAECVFFPIRLIVLRPLWKARVSQRVLRELLAYGVPLLPASMAAWVYTTADRIILEKLTNLAEVGLYGYANTLLALGAVLTGAVAQAWSPHTFEMVRDDPERAAKQFGRAMTYLLVAGGFISVCMTAFSHELVEVLAGHRYAAAASAVPPLALAFVALASVQVTALGISIAKRTRFVAQYSLYAGVLNVVLCLVLIPPYGIVGAAWASTIIATIGLTLGAGALIDSHPGRGLIVKLAFCLGFPILLFAGRALDKHDVAILRDLIRRG